MKPLLYIAIGIGLLYFLQSYLKGKNETKDNAIKEENNIDQLKADWIEYKTQCNLTGGYYIRMVIKKFLQPNDYHTYQITACQFNWFMSTFYPNVDKNSELAILQIVGKVNKSKLEYCDFYQLPIWNTTDSDLDTYQLY